MSDPRTWPTPAEQPDEFLRLPGLFRRWEIEQVLDAGHDFHIEEAGTASDGTQLFAVYRREHDTPNPNQKEEA
jgi:hypothetical protein